MLCISSAKSSMLDLPKRTPTIEQGSDAHYYRLMGGLLNQKLHSRDSESDG